MKVMLAWLHVLLAKIHHNRAAACKSYLKTFLFAHIFNIESIYDLYLLIYTELLTYAYLVGSILARSDAVPGCSRSSSHCSLRVTAFSSSVRALARSPSPPSDSVAATFLKAQALSGMGVASSLTCMRAARTSSSSGHSSSSNCAASSACRPTAPTGIFLCIR